jgi:cell shape-determining protein MreD
MSFIYRKIAAVIAFAIGAMSIFAGSQVVLGKIMDYYVIDWLPIYNLIVGLITVFITAILIWRGSKFAMPAAIATFVSHSAVMLVLQIAYKDVVAPDSIKATTVRIVLWAIILTLMIVQSRKDKQQDQNSPI